MSSHLQTLPTRPVAATGDWADRVETWACTAQAGPAGTSTQEEPCAPSIAIRMIHGALERVPA